MLPALHYSIESLDDGEEKDQRHFNEVEKVDYTNMCIDMMHAGISGAASWGADAVTLPQYRIPYADYEFRFKLIPDKINCCRHEKDIFFCCRHWLWQPAIMSM